MRRAGSRSGGVCLEPAAPTLLAALELFPGARVQLLERGRLPRHEVRERMRRSAYLVALSSHEERAIVEAFANALPVIAPRGATLIEPGRNGLVFEAGDARDLARRLAWAEAFPERMRRMGECAQADYQARFVTHWSWPRLYGERRRQARAGS